MQEEFYCSISVLLLQKLASQYHTSATSNRPSQSCNLISFLWKFNNIQRYISVSPCYDFAKANVDVKRQVSCFIFGLHQYFAQDMLSSEIGQITCRCKMLQYHVSYNWTKPDIDILSQLRTMMICQNHKIYHQSSHYLRNPLHHFMTWLSDHLRPATCSQTGIWWGQTRRVCRKCHSRRFCCSLPLFPT